MSHQVTELAVLWVKERFGSTCSRVAQTLLTFGDLPLALLGYRASLPIRQVKRSLSALMHHELVTFHCDDNGRVFYAFSVMKFNQMLQVPACILAIKTLYGQLAEAIVIQLSVNARMSYEMVFDAVAGALKPDAATFHDTFSKLVGAHFVCRCAPVTNSSSSASDDYCPSYNDYVPDMFVVPDSLCKKISSKEAPQSKKRKLDTATADVDTILWQLHFNKFQQLFRDKQVLTVIESVAENDETIMEVVRHMLRLSATKTPEHANISSSITAHDIVRMAVANDTQLTRQSVEQSLAYLSDDKSAVIRKSGDSGGGIYNIDFERAAQLLCQSSLELLIKEKFDVKGLRIFKLLAAKGHLEQNEIEKTAMLPSKDGKLLLYQMLTDGYVSTRELSKNTDFAPARTYYLFHIDLPSQARTQEQLCYKILRNLTCRRWHEQKEHQWLVQREDKMQTIMANIRSDSNLDDQAKQQQIAEVEQQYMTPSEREQLQQFQMALKVMHRMEVAVQQSLFMWSTFLKYQKRMPPTKAKTTGIV